MMLEPFGRYMLVEKIAKGGMAEVFRAAQVGSAGFAKMVAIKRILPHLAEEPAFVTMLVDEAKIAATLIHPNILQVLDLGEHKGQHFITMEFVVGRSMDAVLATAAKAGVRLPHDFAVHVVMLALQGLAFAHEKTDSFGKPAHIIHRDVSPHNIMVGFDGSVKLADFGIARAAERNTHTLTGTIKGKPGYMSPEQVQGEHIDQRLDIYAMGVVLHECLAMKRMRRANSDVQILMAVASGEYPKFEDQGIQVPPVLSAAVYKALAPRPADRWQGARQFIAALEDVNREQGWHCTQSQVAGIMARLFPAEIEKERDAQVEFARVIKEPPEPDGVSVILSEPSQVLPGVHTPSRPSVSGARTVAPPTPAPPPAARPAEHAASAPVPPPPVASDELPTTVTPRGLPSLVSVPAMAPVVQPAPFIPPPTDTALRDRSARGGGGIVLASVMAVCGLGAGAWFFTRPTPAPLPLPVATPAPVAAVGGPLVVETDPAGAAVTIDGKAREGRTPLVISDLSPGDHVVVAALAGARAEQRETVALAAGTAATVRLRFELAAVTVRVTTQPPGARVTLDGRALGTSPLEVEVDARAGGTLRAEAVGHSPAERPLAAGAVPSTAELVLQPLPVAAPAEKPAKKGGTRKTEPVRRPGKEPAAVAPAAADTTPAKLTLTSKPWGNVFLDGKDTGKFTPALGLSVPPGKHTIKLVNPEEGISATFTVDLKPGEEASFSRELK
ncbi:MAG: serine/threonine protein kinase [Deltaproteobacteria bacterium]|nr:serine/threonine protein kinase [Deltaproteobacteria bacterium]